MKIKREAIKLDLSKYLIVKATAMRDVRPSHWFAQKSFELLVKPCRTIDIYMENIYDIGHAYNFAVKEMLKIPEATHILFIEDDVIIPDKRHLMTLFYYIEDNYYSRHIVSGLYYMKRYPHYPFIMTLIKDEGIYKIAFPFANREVPNNCAMKVGVVPTGFLLVKREVFEKIPEPWFVLNDPELNKEIQETPRVATQDVYFSKKATEYGFDLFVDCRVDLLHYVPKFVGREERVEEFSKGIPVEEQLENVMKDVRAVYHPKRIEAPKV